jgi:hypothetical protein
MNCTAVVSPPPTPVFAQVSRSRDMVHSVLQMLTSREQLAVASVSRTFNATQGMINDKHIELSSHGRLGSSATVTSLKLVGDEWIHEKVVAVLSRSPNVVSLDLGDATFVIESHVSNPLDALNRFITEIQSKGKRLTKFVFPELWYLGVRNSAKHSTEDLLSNLDLRGLVHLDITKADLIDLASIFIRIREASQLKVFYQSESAQQQYLHNLPPSVQNLSYHYRPKYDPEELPLFIERLHTNPINELALTFTPPEEEDLTTQFFLSALLPALKTVKHVKLRLNGACQQTPPFIVDPIIDELVQSQTLETLDISGYLSIDSVLTILERLRSSKTIRKIQFTNPPMHGWESPLLHLLLQYPPSIKVEIYGHNFNFTTRENQLESARLAVFYWRRQALISIRDSRNHRSFTDDEKKFFLQLQTFNYIPKQMIIGWYREIGVPQATIDAADREGLSSLDLISAIEGIPVKLS